jgi:hypothetical protein
MRLIQRRALIVAVAVALVSSLAVLPSVASAAKTSSPIQKLNKRVTAISKSLNVVANNLKNVTGTVNQGIPIITQLVSGLQAAASGLTQLQAALTTAGNGLKALQTAVTDPVGGLAALNAIRPVVAIVPSGASPTVKGNPGVTLVLHPGAGLYVLGFGQDVSGRVVSVTPFPYLPGHPLVSAALNCSVVPPSGCPATSGFDTSKNDVLVQEFDAASPATGVDGGFQAAAIAP